MLLLVCMCVCMYDLLVVFVGLLRCVCVYFVCR